MTSYIVYDRLLFWWHFYHQNQSWNVLEKVQERVIEIHELLVYFLSCGWSCRIPMLGSTECHWLNSLGMILLTLRAGLIRARLEGQDSYWRPPDRYFALEGLQKELWCLAGNFRLVELGICPKVSKLLAMES